MGTKDPLGTAYRLAMSNKLMASGNPVDSMLANEELQNTINAKSTIKRNDNSRISTRT